jgi:hypothetical protein
MQSRVQSKLTATLLKTQGITAQGAIKYVDCAQNVLAAGALVLAERADDAAETKHGSRRRNIKKLALSHTVRITFNTSSFLWFASWFWFHVACWMAISMAVWMFLFLFLDLIQAPPSIPSDRGAVLVSNKSGTVRWRAEWTMDPAEEDGRKLVRFTEQGRGRVSNFRQEVQWSLEAVWSADDGLRPLDSEKTTKAASGALLLSEKKHFDRGTGVVRFERQFPGGPSESKSLPVAPDTLAVEGIAGILRFLPFQPSMSFPAHLLSNEPSLYSVTMEARGRERVKTPAGEFECYKVELVPHVGILNVFRAFYPKTFFWFTIAPPHRWVRYEGPENGRGTPEVVMELDAQ